MGGPNADAAARYWAGVRDWSRNTSARCSASARDSSCRVGSSIGALRSTPATSAPSEGWSGVICRCAMARLSCGLTAVGTAAALSQPEPDEVTLALGLGPVAEGRPFVCDPPVVDELHLAGFEVK